MSSTDTQKARVDETLEKGHAAHTQSAAMKGLPGEMNRPIKLAFLGAGSHFTMPLMRDLICIPGNRGGEIVLIDIDEARMNLSRQVIEMVIEEFGAKGWKVSATTDRTEAFPGCHYVVNCVEVAGLDCVVSDNDIPLRYGVDQCIGDTLGPGGLFKALRTAPVWLDILADCERLCPDAWVLNYTNPMGILCKVAAMKSSMKVVGLCHSVQGTSKKLAGYAGVPYEEMEWECAGINHLAWFTKLSHNGEDLYPRLKEKFSREVANGLEGHDEAPDPSVDLQYGADRDLVRKEMCLQFGAFITESSGHLSEYLPYYRKNASGRRVLRPGYDGESRFYATHWPSWRKRQDAERREILETRDMTTHRERSWEYASWIIEAREKNSPFVIHGNVPNRAPDGTILIENLPQDACVEVACEVNASGMHPRPFGRLPTVMASICSSNISMINLASEAIVEGSKEKAIHSLMLDPLTSAVCSTFEIREMANEMFEAQKKFLPQYS